MVILAMVKLANCAWIRFFFLIFLLTNTLDQAFSQQIIDRQIFNQHYAAKTYQPPFAVTAKVLTTHTSPDAIINIKPGIKLAPVLPTQFGVNTTFRNGPDQRLRKNLYTGLVTTMRFPGGSGSNLYFFDGKIPSQFEPYIDNTGQTMSVSAINGISNSAMTPATFINFKNDINGQPIIVINYFYARYGVTSSGTREARVKQAAEYAASFVKKINIELKGNVKYWEIGNECYGKWEVGYQISKQNIGILTGKEYGEDFRVFVQAMKSVDNTIKIGAVVKDEEDEWNKQVLPEVKDHADFLSVHNYFTTENDATATNILASVGQIGQIKKLIETQITRYTGKPKDYFPLALTEFNARGPYNCTMVNGIFISQVLGEIIKNGFGLSALWVSEWNWSEEAQESKGFLARNDPEQADYTARQSYVPFYYYNKVFGDNMVFSESSNSGIACYASTFSSGEIGLVLTNATSQSQKVSLTINNGSTNIGKIHWYDMYANTIEPTEKGYKKFFINDLTSSTSGGGPANLEAVYPYESVYEANSVFVMRPYSVVFLNMKTGSITGTTTPAFKRNNDRIIPYIVNEETQILDNENIQKIELYSYVGGLMAEGKYSTLLTDKLANGYYILKATFKDKIVVNRFVLIK
jgi:hypothetical protein